MADLKPTEEAPVRRDLIEGSTLLSRLASLIDVVPAERDRSITIAAPHHADRDSWLADGHDVSTGHLARRVAKALEARCVVADELRGVVDLNKNAFAASPFELGHPGEKARRVTDRNLKLFYQSQVFRHLPRIVVEVHGFAGTGGEDFQVSCGHTLDRSVPRDASLWTALERFKASLSGQLRHASGALRDASVGVYPIDPVRLRATGTHTFRLLELLRELGFNVGGLHIEVRRPLRPDPSTHPEVYDEIARHLVTAIREFSQALGTESYDAKARLEHMGGDRTVLDPKLLQGDPLTVRLAPRELIGQDVALVSERTMARWDLDEDAPVLVLKWATDKSGTPVRLRGGAAQDRAILLNKALRDRVGVEPGQKVHVALPGALQRGAGCAPVCVARITDAGQGPDLVWWSGSQSRGLPEEPRRVTVVASNGEERAVSADRMEVHGAPIAGYPPEYWTPERQHGQWQYDARVVGLSTGLAQQLGVTFGDIVGLRFDEADSEKPANEQI